MSSLSSSQGGLTLAVTPARARIDVPRQITVSGLAPGESVTVRTQTERAGVVWHAQARFVADASGRVDVSSQPAVDGDYTGIAPMGLIWSQRPTDGRSRTLFHDDVMAPLTTQLHAVGEQGAQAQAELVQHLADEGVTRREIREDGLVGTLFLPPGPGPHPAVVIVNGSGGGINEPRGALYASHGYAALALGYFKAPGLSDFISNTPLEYFEDALEWVQRVVKPRNGFVALSGQSRGGELVLLLGSLFPERVSAVVGYVPGAVVHGGQNAADPAVGRDGAAWLYGGEPIPYVWQNNRTATWAPWDEGDGTDAPRRHTNAVLTALDDPDAVERARIRVENIRGPVIVLSGSDDGSWPSSLYGRMVVDRLAAHDHPYPVQQVDVEGAGHAILFPFVPTTQLVYAHPVSGRLSTSGGTPPVNAQADEVSWQAVTAFLRNAVAAHDARASS